MNLELSKDTNMHMFICISMVSKTNTPYTNDYGLENDNNYLMYNDSNNIYGLTTS